MLPNLLMLELKWVPHPYKRFQIESAGNKRNNLRCRIDDPLTDQ